MAETMPMHGNVPAGTTGAKHPNLKRADRFRIVAVAGVPNQTLEGELSDTLCSLHFLKIGVRRPDGMRAGGEGRTLFDVRDGRGAPLSEAAQAALDRAIANAYVCPENAWPDHIEPRRTAPGDMEATLVSHQPVRTFRKTFRDLSLDDLMRLMRDLDVKPRTGKKALAKPEWSTRDRSLVEGGLTYLRITGPNGVPLDEATANLIDAAVREGYVPTQQAVATSTATTGSDRNEGLLAWLEKGNLADVLERPQLLDDDTWLLHFSPDAETIVDAGFRRGTPRMGDLGFSHGATSTKRGFNYAFDASDEYSIRTAVEYDSFGGNKDRAVLFRSGGVGCRFVTDDFNQVIFWGPGAAEPFLLLTADHEAEGNQFLEPHDWAWTLHLPNGRQVECDNLFEAIRQASHDTGSSPDIAP